MDDRSLTDGLEQGHLAEALDASKWFDSRLGLQDHQEKRQVWGRSLRPDCPPVEHLGAGAAGTPGNLEGPMWQKILHLSKKLTLSVFQPKKATMSLFQPKKQQCQFFWAYKTPKRCMLTFARFCIVFTTGCNNDMFMCIQTVVLFFVLKKTSTRTWMEISTIGNETCMPQVEFGKVAGKSHAETHMKRGSSLHFWQCRAGRPSLTASSMGRGETITKNPSNFTRAKPAAHAARLEKCIWKFSLIRHARSIVGFEQQGLGWASGTQWPPSGPRPAVVSFNPDGNTKPASEQRETTARLGSFNTASSLHTKRKGASLCE